MESGRAEHSHAGQVPDARYFWTFAPRSVSRKPVRWQAKRDASESLADLGEGEPLRVSELDPGRKARPQDLILSEEIFVLQKQTLVHQPSHISQ